VSERLESGKERYRRYLAREVLGGLFGNSDALRAEHTKIVNTIFDLITKALHRREKVVIPGLGTFHVIELPGGKQRTLRT
jgi:nucleoid DNA-binding protein